jgi:hypothetical protein
MKIGPLFFVVLLLLVPIAANSQSATSAPEKVPSRWVEFDYDDNTITYDLTTIQMIEPGKFTVISSTVDHPDVMRLKLKVLDTLRSYCTRPDGEYPPPTALFMLGKPDMPVEKIEVKSKQADREGTEFKNVVWRLPYLKLALNSKTGPEENIEFFDCKGPAVKSIDDEYNQMRSLITNGIFSRELYDCKRGVMGFFVHNDDPVSKAITTTNIRGAYSRAYVSLCHNVTGEWPYLDTPH